MRPFLARRTDLPQIADRQSGLRLCALLVLACRRRVRCGGRRRPVDPARQGLRLHPLQRLDQITAVQRRQVATGMDLLPPACSAATRASPWSWTTPCMSSRRGPNVLYAFDLTQGRLPAALEVPPRREPQRDRRLLLRHRSTAAPFYADGKIIYNLLDGHTVAVDAKTGRGAVEDAGRRPHATARPSPMAPLVVKDRVIVGPSGGEFGIYGWVKALDLKTGQVVWTGAQHRPRRRHARQARHFQAVLRQRHRPRHATSWAEDTWQHGGAPVWGWMSYDPELDLVYYGTGNPRPITPSSASGDNKWTASVLARRPADGSLVWAYQFTPARQLGLRRQRRA